MGRWEGLESGFLPFFVDLWAQKARDVYRQKRKSLSLTAKNCFLTVLYVFSFTVFMQFFFNHLSNGISNITATLLRVLKTGSKLLITAVIFAVI